MKIHSKDRAGSGQKKQSTQGHEGPNRDSSYDAFGGLERTQQAAYAGNSGAQKILASRGRPVRRRPDMTRPIRLPINLLAKIEIERKLRLEHVKIAEDPSIDAATGLIIESDTLIRIAPRHAANQPMIWKAMEELADRIEQRKGAKALGEKGESEKEESGEEATEAPKESQATSKKDDGADTIEQENAPIAWDPQLKAAIEASAGRPLPDVRLERSPELNRINKKGAADGTQTIKLASGQEANKKAIAHESAHVYQADGPAEKGAAAAGKDKDESDSEQSGVAKAEEESQTEQSGASAEQAESSGTQSEQAKASQGDPAVTETSGPEKEGAEKVDPEQEAEAFAEAVLAGQEFEIKGKASGVMYAEGDGDELSADAPMASMEENESPAGDGVWASMPESSEEFEGQSTPEPQGEFKMQMAG